MSEKIVVLVTGATGLLGRQVMKMLGARDSLDVRGIRFTRGEGGHNLVKQDLTDLDGISSLLEQMRPSWVVHAAAERFPDRVASDPEAAKLLNVGVSEHLAKEAKRLGARMIFISTDYVFDGRSPPYKHDSDTRPSNIYGETKVGGERAVLGMEPTHIVLRIPVLYGGVERVAESAVTVLLDLVRARKEAQVSSFEVRCPSHTRDIAGIILGMVEQRDMIEGGVYQWCGLERLSKWDMVQLVATEFKLDMSHLKELAGPVQGVERPRDVEMDRSRVKGLGLGTHTNFKEGLMEDLNKFL